jgi:hypothetical protein
MAYNLTDDDLAEAVGETEHEIFSDAFGGSHDPADVESWDDIVEDMSQMHDWNGGQVSDTKLSHEASGDTPIGMSLAVDDDDLQAAFEQGRQAGAQQLYGELAPHLPRPQRPDMFAEPDRWEQELLQRARDPNAVSPPHGYGTNPQAKPDMFADPDGYERWMVGEIQRRSGIDQFHADRVNQSLAAAHREFGEDFEQAYGDISQRLDPRNPTHANLVRGIVNDENPGRALMQARDMIEAANASSMRHGGPPFAPGLVRQRAPLRNSAGEGPRSRFEAEEMDVFRDALDDQIWGGF